MCFGGGGSPATIVMPDTRAYDRQAEMQMDLMRQMQQGQLAIKQQELNSALAGQQQVLADFRDFKVAQADEMQFKASETSANAARINALIGAPPPEPSAQAPVVGSDRNQGSRAKGKKSLRIDRPAPSTQASGTGMNLTTA